ncbi:MAG TPA: discoidin domain-containing protein, partial [Saprospiraceae bacterium]|nr:discoidin domain-containing protein [Saprospiraceae bacterium]
RGTSHWIRYDLGHTYSIANIDIWNFNHPDSIDMGIRDAVIDVSLDGVTWTSMGQFTVPRANGSTLYAGAKSVHNLGFQPVRYLLITPITNYGGSSCYGFSEIKMHLAGSLLPVTISDIAVNCKNNKPSLTWKSEKEKDIIAYEILGSDNAENWKVYQTVTPKGSGKYAAILDEHTPSYLRIRALEVTNNNTVSDIVLNDCSNGLNVFSASPNPFEQQFSLTHTPSLRSVPQRVLIRDVGGRIVYTQYLS